jgi:hypothetical protein
MDHADIIKRMTTTTWATQLICFHKWMGSHPMEPVSSAACWNSQKATIWALAIVRVAIFATSMG